MADFRKLKVWQKSHELALNCQAAAKRIRGNEYSALRTQLVRAAMSIPTNLVEGRARTSEKEFTQFIAYSIGSAAELEYHLLVAKDSHVMPEVDFDRLSLQVIEVRKMLYALRRTLQSAPA